MKHLKILIIEDEVLIAEDLKDLLFSFDFKQVEMAHSLGTGLEKLSVYKPDIALLDIRMEGELDGLKLAQFINKEMKIPFVFITSHSDLETIKKIVELKPSGYITKPFKRSDIYACLNLMAGTLNKKNKVLIKDGHKTNVFEWDEIDYIEGEGNYINIFCGNRKVVARQSMDSVLDQLDKDIYYKIHRSYIVNLKNIIKFNRKEISIGNVTIPVSRNVQDELEEKLKGLN